MLIIINKHSAQAEATAGLPRVAGTVKVLLLSLLIVSLLLLLLVVVVVVVLVVVLS